MHLISYLFLICFLSEFANFYLQGQFTEMYMAHYVYLVMTCGPGCLSVQRAVILRTNSICIALM